MRALLLSVAAFIAACAWLPGRDAFAAEPPDSRGKDAAPPAEKGDRTAPPVSDKDAKPPPQESKDRISPSKAKDAADGRKADPFAPSAAMRERQKGTAPSQPPAASDAQQSGTAPAAGAARIRTPVLEGVIVRNKSVLACFRVGASSVLVEPGMGFEADGASFVFIEYANETATLRDGEGRRHEIRAGVRTSRAPGATPPIAADDVK